MLSFYFRYNPNEKRVSEQDNWETIQRDMTQTTVGAQDKKQRGDEYELVQEDEIEFIERLVNNGINVEEMLKEQQVMQEQMEAATSEFEKIQIQRANLPVTRCKNQILEYVNNHNIIIVEAETGSGKTTQIPQFLHEAGYLLWFCVHAQVYSKGYHWLYPTTSCRLYGSSSSCLQRNGM